MFQSKTKITAATAHIAVAAKVALDCMPEGIIRDYIMRSVNL